MMKRLICAFTAAAALMLTACSSDDDIWDGLFDDPADFTAATRIEPSAPDSSMTRSEPSAETDTDSAEDESTEREEDSSSEAGPPLNEYGLIDQYYINSKTYQFNLMLAGMNFTANVKYYISEDGKNKLRYSEYNEVSGTDRHQRITVEDEDLPMEDADIYYLKNAAGVYGEYQLNWEDSSYSQLQANTTADISAFCTTVPSTLFYGIDDLETAVYMGYLPDSEKGTVTEKFRIEDDIYTFTYDSDGILLKSKVGKRMAKVVSFENSCPPIGIPTGFQFK